MLGSERTATFASPALRIAGLVAVGCVAIVAAWSFPQLDHALNPTAAYPGLISFLGVGMSVLVLTTLLFAAGLRALLPRSVLFVAAALAYNGLLVAVKFGLGPMALYATSSSGSYSGFLFLDMPLAFPGVAAIAAVLY